ncbi:uncharacterized protein LOC134180470 [Corticium candelabrum]|uniref:uncharacterized protein LOC134180470 n=1 Tax=Corticium candelabrum TaxID=121492 RepID=UPI002E262D87|nr:uncharacterized protein LOC134180470 [Corticium candelabrum]
MSLQVYKYSGSNSTEELIGEARNCDLSSSFAIAIANCTGFSVKLVGKTCEESKLSSTAITTFYYSTKIVSESRFDDCQRSSCGDAACFSLSNIRMGYRCYCKKWYNGSCIPTPQATTKNVNTCNCPPTNFLGEICYLDGHRNISHSDSPKTTNVIIQTPTPFATARSVTATKPSASPLKVESGGSSVSIAPIAAGLAGAIVIILVVVVIIILYRRRLKQSESSQQASESRTS